MTRAVRGLGVPRGVLATGLLSGLLAGCATPSWLCFAPDGPSTVTLIADPAANQQTAVTVDLVFITDKLAAQRITALSAQDYFEQRTQIERDFPTGVVRHSWGLAPGQIERDVKVHPMCNRTGTVLFARYLTPGEHRQILGDQSAIVVSLNARDFTVSP